MIHTGTHAVQVTRSYKISRRYVSNIKGISTEIIRRAVEQGRILNYKTVSLPQFTVIKEQVFNFVVSARALKYPIMKSIIVQRALLLRGGLLRDNTLDDMKLQRVQFFKDSKG